MTADKEALLAKQKKALALVNDAYEMGDYSREEWIERRKKREKEICRLSDEIYNIRKSSCAELPLTNAERVKALSNFFDNIVQATTSVERNDLYRTIIDSIIWHRDGNDIKARINYK